MLRYLKMTFFLALVFSMVTVAAGAAPQKPTADEAKVAAIVKSGEMTTAKLDQIVKIMASGHYYGMRVDWHYLVNGEKASSSHIVGNTTETMQDLIRYKKPQELTDIKVYLWKDPSPSVTAAAQATAKEVIEQIYNEITDLSESYPELDLFNTGHVKLTDEGFFYEPNQGQSHTKMDKPTILVGVREPQLGGMAQAYWPNVLYPRQKIEIYYNAYLENQELKTKIYTIIKKAVKPLADAEKRLGSEPIGHGNSL